MGAERILDLEGVNVELQPLSSDEDAKPPGVLSRKPYAKRLDKSFFRYHRLALAESVLDRTDGEFRLLIYSEFLRRHEDPEWNLKPLLELARKAFGSLCEERPKNLERSLTSLSKCIEELTTSHNTNGVQALRPSEAPTSASLLPLLAPLMKRATAARAARRAALKKTREPRRGRLRLGRVLGAASRSQPV